MDPGKIRSLTLQVDGIAIVRRAFTGSEVVELLPLCSTIRRQWLECDPLTGQPGGDERSEACMRHVNHPSYFEKDPKRLRLILEACANKTIISALRKAWRAEPVFRSTTLFFTPRTDQPANWHRDSQFAHSDPADERKTILRLASGGGSVAQIQLPLIDSDDLEYVPGSQRRWDTPEESRIRLSIDPGTRCNEELPGSVRCAVKAGDAVIFDPYGIHRGRYSAGSQRMTLMVTFVQASSRPEIDRFSFQPWFLSNGYLDGLSPHANAVYQRFIERYGNLWLDVSCTDNFHSGWRS